MGEAGRGCISAKLFLIFFTSSLISNIKRNNECRRIRKLHNSKFLVRYSLFIDVWFDAKGDGYVYLF